VYGLPFDSKRNFRGASCIEAEMRR
jgi:hypothetical protein